MSESGLPPLEELPQAQPDPPRSRRLPLVWILPATVAVLAALVVIQQRLAQGPTIEIGFRTVEGLEPNKTKIRYRDVEIGEVTAIHVASDRKQVMVTARIHRDARDYLVEDTRFWIVRPRVVGGNVSGLGTLVSGAYIGMDVGRSKVERERFAGLETPPIVAFDVPGREFILHADDIGSVSVGSALYYRHLSAGQVVAYALDPAGTSVTMRVFVYAPFDAYVTGATRFWQASGIDMSVDSEGLKLHTESLTALLEGGIAFQNPPGAESAESAPAGAAFTLFSDRDRAMRQPETQVNTFVMYFKGSLRGLAVGAPVDLGGIVIGEVKGLSVEYDRAAGELRFPVEVDIFPQRIRGRRGAARHPDVIDRAAPQAARALIDDMVAHGLRAEIRTGNLLTGQKYVALDVHKDVPAEAVRWNEQPAVFPTTRGALDEIQESIGSIAKKLDRVPFDRISARLLATMASLDRSLESLTTVLRRVDGRIAPQVEATLTEAQAAMKNAKETLAADGPLQTDLNAALLQLARAAKSVDALMDYLQRHPESLLRGKPGDPP